MVLGEGEAVFSGSQTDYFRSGPFWNTTAGNYEKNRLFTSCNEKDVPEMNIILQYSLGKGVSADPAE